MFFWNILSSKNNLLHRQIILLPFKISVLFSIICLLAGHQCGPLEPNCAMTTSWSGINEYEFTSIDQHRDLFAITYPISFFAKTDRLRRIWRSHLTEVLGYNRLLKQDLIFFPPFCLFLQTALLWGKNLNLESSKWIISEVNSHFISGRGKHICIEMLTLLFFAH